MSQLSNLNPMQLLDLMVQNQQQPGSLQQALQGMQQPQPNPQLSNEPDAEARANWGQRTDAAHYIEHDEPHKQTMTGQHSVRGAGIQNFFETIKNGGTDGDRRADTGVQSGDESQTTPQLGEESGVDANSYASTRRYDPRAGTWVTADEQAKLIGPQNPHFRPPQDETPVQTSPLLASIAQSQSGGKMGPPAPAPRYAPQQGPQPEMQIVRGTGPTAQTSNVNFNNGVPVETPTNAFTSLISSNANLNPAQRAALAQYASTPGMTLDKLQTVIGGMQRTDATANKPPAGNISPLQQWRTKNQSLLTERNTAYRDFRASQNRVASMADSFLYSEADKQKAQDDVDSARQRYESADKSYTDSVNSIPENSGAGESIPAMPANNGTPAPPLGPPSTAAVPRNGITASPNPITANILDNMKQTATYQGKQYQIGQTIPGPDRKTYKVVGFDPQSGEPLVAPQ